MGHVSPSIPISSLLSLFLIGPLLGRKEGGRCPVDGVPLEYENIFPGKSTTVIDRDPTRRRIKLANFNPSWMYRQFYPKGNPPVSSQVSVWEGRMFRGPFLVRT